MFADSIPRLPMLVSGVSMAGLVLKVEIFILFLFAFLVDFEMSQ